MTDLAVADLSHIPVSQGLSATLARASEGARATGAREVSLEHVLAALCDDADAADVLAASHIDPVRLKSEAIAYLAHMDYAGGPQPAGAQIGVSVALMRILEAAAAAARGGRRRDINGAIVLAAIVGDGASVAAQLLQVHGLTFDGAIRALQAALAQPSRPEAPAMAPAEDVLARARERVQSRAAPSLRDIMLEKSQGQAPMTPPAPPASGDFPDLVAPYGGNRQPGPDTKVSGTEESSPPPVQTVGLPSPTADYESEVEPPAETREQSTAAPLGAGEDASEQPSAAVPAASDVRVQPTQAEASAGEAAKPQTSEPPAPKLSSDVGAQPPPNPNSPGGGGNWQPSFESAAAPPAPTPAMPSPRAAQPSFPSPPPPPGGVQSYAPGPPGGPATGPPPNAVPLPPGFEVRRSGGPQPPPIPPPMPKGPPPQAGFGTPPVPRPPNAPHGPAPGLPHGLPPVAGGVGPQAFPMGRPQGTPSGVTPPPRMSAPVSPPPAPRGRETTREPAKAELGQLTENIPRAMRVGVTERVEIRIGRAHIKNLAEGMEGGGLAWRHEVTVTKAMSVRIRAPEGGFFIETASPETQWIDNQFEDAGNDFASWRFLITPQQRGWAGLRIIILARTVGSDGVVAETAFPDQVIEVKVRTNYGRAFKRTMGWLLAAIAGGVLARFGEGAFDAGSGLISKLLG